MIEVPATVLVKLPRSVIVEVDQHAVDTLVAEDYINARSEYKVLGEGVLQLNSGGGTLVDCCITGLYAERFGAVRCLG